MALVPLPAPYSSLPAPLTSLVGRTGEIAAVVALLRHPGMRLVTLTGPGGVGKTRLALAVATELIEERGGQIEFIELATVREPDDVLPTIAVALGVRGGGAPGEGPPLVARLATALRGRRFLLVLDNLEQVLDAAPRLAELLRACADLTLLVTSRAPLRISGEHEFPVPPLSLGRWGGEAVGRREHERPTASPPDRPSAPSEAVQLFAARARAVAPEFALTEANATSVRSICERLDGLPLAIELAAARIAVLSPRAIEARLTDRLRLLTGGPRDQPSRLRSMRDAIVWSYELLSSQERTLFRCLGCFAGGCTLEAAGAVCGEAGVDVLDGVQTLVGQSLLRRLDQPGETPRYGMLETIRECAIEWLEACGEAETTRARHATYYVELAGRPKLTWWVLEETIGEQANLRSALAWAIERGTTELILPLGIAVWQLLEPAADYRALERAVEATAETPSNLHGKRVLLLAATAQYALWRSATTRASELIEESVALAKTTDESGEVALAMLVLGAVATGERDLDRGEALAEEARRRWQALGEPSWVGEALCQLACVAGERGERTRSEALLDESVAIARAVGPEPALVLALGLLGGRVFERGDHRRAAALLAESIELACRVRDPVVVETNIALLAAVATAAGRAEPAIRLFGATRAWKERFGFDDFPIDAAWLDHAIDPARAQLDDHAFTAAWEAGRTLTLNQAAAEALAIAEAIRAEPPPENLASSPIGPAAQYGLTARELEVWRLIAEGHSTKEIADVLFISRRTVQTHTTRLFAKLGVPSRNAATALAHRLGIC